MQAQFPEIYVLIAISSVVALMLITFIVAMVIFYRKKQFSHEQELLKTQLEIQEHVFKDVSQEIHDNIGQVLSVIKLTLASAPVKQEDPAYEYLKDSKTMVSGVIEDISDLSKSLHPDRVLKIGIAEAVEFELNKLQKTGQFQTTMKHPEKPIVLSTKNEIFLFRILQEILNNIVKHSEADNISVVMDFDGENTTIEVRDDGKGFDIEKTLQRSTKERGIGLSSMKNRMKMIGGTFEIKSAPGFGTTVHIYLKGDRNTPDNKMHYSDVEE
jgi:two-component system NarL family sensor kinase